MTLSVLDLFSGIGGNTLALHGITRTVAYCEFDKHAQAVLKSRMADGLIPDAPIFPDVTTLKGSDVGTIDMIVGGFPCQDISCAGKGAGIAEGTRSGLFYQIMRLTDELQPRFLFLENVPAIRTRGLDIVLREITERGYDCRWTMLSAAQVGARHKRERWFALAVRRDQESTNAEHSRRQPAAFDSRDTTSVCGSAQGTDRTCEFEGVDTPRDVAYSNERGLQKTRTKLEATGFAGEGANVSDTCESGLQRGEASRYLGCEGENSEQYVTRRHQSHDGGAAKSSVGGMVNGISERLVEGLPDYLRAGYWEKEPCERVTQEREQRVERIKRLGNAVVPLQARTAFIKLMFNEARRG
jgi:DNA (cytosine-5)-methyltransferase 1